MTCELIEDGGGWSHYEGTDVGSAEGEHFHESGWMLAEARGGGWLACNTMADREDPLRGATTLDEAKAALKAMVLGFFAEDPHGWVSVGKAMPEVGERVEVWWNKDVRGLRLWPLGGLSGVTHWRIPTPGPQTSTGGE